MSEGTQPPGPDLSQGISEGDVLDGAAFVGHVGNEPVVLVRRGKELFAVGATCTHYGGPLGEGLVVDDTIRCPWHHACFNLRTGEALAAPAIAPTSCWRVERKDGQIFVREKLERVVRRGAKPKLGDRPERMVIVGGGAAGFAAAEMLRREGFGGGITILSADADAPYDRPNLSKDYLAGTAPEEWVPLSPESFYIDNDIELRLRTKVTGIDPERHRVIIEDDEVIDFTKLLLATGAEPIQLQVRGATLSHVRTLRSLEDCRQIIARAKDGSRAIVVGASFIGLETAAALRRRHVDVHIVAPELRPMERVLGAAMGDYLRALHEQHGVVFHLGHTLAGIEKEAVLLDDGSHIEAQLVVVGVGVRPRLELAEKAGLTTNGDVLVNGYLETTASDIFAAGDITRWSDPYSGERIRVEHWVVAERQGQTAARNMLGRQERYAVAPFFWTQHYDVPINYVGHAVNWDSIDQDGDLRTGGAVLRLKKGGRTHAVVTVFRDQASLEAELAMDKQQSP